ncbi:hypothetical protein BDV41DRAFT_556911 [Aspergillus transmontanensis]|uniref:Uncharacterized protein n=1 Tax=Aspergillus transmontanensis TaxID=1034304 RepID=A0A5N6VFD3_9EURO|nr:hypothetical protein BDV41DRAFT_556911 [Aspergillus transmontanensis]
MRSTILHLSPLTDRASGSMLLQMSVTVLNFLLLSRGERSCHLGTRFDNCATTRVVNGCSAGKIKDYTLPFKYTDWSS